MPTLSSDPRSPPPGPLGTPMLSTDPRSPLPGPLVMPTLSSDPRARRRSNNKSTSAADRQTDRQDTHGVGRGRPKWSSGGQTKRYPSPSIFSGQHSCCKSGAARCCKCKSHEACSPHRWMWCTSTRPPDAPCLQGTCRCSAPLPDRPAVANRWLSLSTQCSVLLPAFRSWQIFVPAISFGFPFQTPQV